LKKSLLERDPVIAIDGPGAKKRRRQNKGDDYVRQEKTGLRSFKKRRDARLLKC